MAVRNFDGVDDSLDLALPSYGAPTTFACLLHKTLDGSFETPMYAAQSGGVAIWGMLFSSSNQLDWADANNNSESTLTVTNAGGWYICVVSHPGGNGTDVGRMHTYNLTSATWSHHDGDTASGIDVSNNTGVGGTLRLGNTDVDLPFQGRIATIGVWNVELTDLEVEALSANLATQDWADTQTANLELLADLNQASTGTDVTDLSGNGHDQSAINGTNVVTTDDPPSWTFGVSAGGETHSGTAAISSTTSFSASGDKAALGASSISATASVTATGDKSSSGAGAVSATPSFTVSGAKAASAAVSFTELLSSLTATGKKAAEASIEISGTASFTVTVEGQEAVAPTRTLMGVGI